MLALLRKMCDLRCAIFYHGCRVIFYARYAIFDAKCAIVVVLGVMFYLRRATSEVRLGWSVSQNLNQRGKVLPLKLKSRKSTCVCKPSLIRMPNWLMSKS